MESNSQTLSLMSQTFRGIKEHFFNSTSGIFTAGVVDTIGKFATGVVDTGGAP
jgi:hypothetical protein